MDSHKKNMIRNWVEHQTFQIQKTKHPAPHQRTQDLQSSSRHGSTKDMLSPKELTQFKTCSSDEIHEDETVYRPLNSGKKHEIVEEGVIRTGLKLSRWVYPKI